MPPRRLAVHPVGPDRWDDFARLFEAKGAPHYCWCAPYRFADAPSMGKAEKHAAMERLVREGTPIGVLAYDGDEAVGWCSVAPRETYARLARSRTMPRASDAPTWTVLCFFVPRAWRGEGVPLALLEGAVRHAASQGAEEIEGYPYDTAGITSTHRGRSETFAAAGFEQEGARWVLRVGARRR